MGTIFGLYRFSGLIAAKMPSKRRQICSRAAREVIRRAADTENEEMACAVYHYPCIDGAFAALAAHLYHSLLGLPVVFLPNSTIDPLRAEDFDCKKFHTCYLLDFVGPNEFAIKLSQIVKHRNSAGQDGPATGPKQLRNMPVAGDVVQHKNAIGSPQNGCSCCGHILTHNEALPSCFSQLSISHNFKKCLNVGFGMYQHIQTFYQRKKMQVFAVGKKVSHEVVEVKALSDKSIKST